MSGLHTRGDLRILLPLTIGLFVASCIVRFSIADYPKGIGVLPDEIRYLDLASSLFNNGELIQRGGLSSFQKILFPVLLAPAFLLDDPLARAQAITALSCVYVSSALFPALVLARRIFAKTGPIVACLLFTMIMPDMCYSMTFLSESAYLPLALWLIACCHVALEKRGASRCAWSTCAGALCYLAYLCKEVALGFALAVVLLMVFDLVSKRSEGRGSGISLACFVAGFALPFVIMKLTLFAGLPNSYDQADPSVLANPYALLYSLYALVFDSTHFAIAFAFFPLVLPALTWPRLDRRERDLYLLCLLSFVFILLAVVYTISIREDLGHVGIRPHVRYVAPIFLPLLFLFVKQVLRGDGKAIMRDPRPFAAALCATLAMVLLVAFMYGDGDYAQGFDSAQFHAMRIMEEGFDALPIDPASDATDAIPEDDVYHGAYLDIDPGIWISKAFVCAFLIFGLWALLSWQRKRAGMAVLGIIALSMILNTLGMYQYNSSVYKVRLEDVDEVCVIEAFVDGLEEGEQVLIVYDDGSSSANNLMDVYVDNDRLNVSYIEEGTFRFLLDETDATQKILLVNSDVTMGDNMYGANGRTSDENAGIAYFVVNDRQGIELSPSCAVEITPEGISSYAIYRVLPGKPLMLDSAAAD